MKSIVKSVQALITIILMGSPHSVKALAIVSPANPECITSEQLDLFSLKRHIQWLYDEMQKEGIESSCIEKFLEYSSRSANDALPTFIIKDALFEIIRYIDTQRLDQNNHTRFCKNDTETPSASLVCSNDPTHQSRTRRKHGSKKIYEAFVRYLSAYFLKVLENAHIEGDTTISGNELVKGDVVVSGILNATIDPVFPGGIELIGNPQQTCITFVDDTMAEKARICSSPIAGDKGVFISVDGGVTQNLRVVNQGGVSIATPTSGTGLTITGGGETISSGDLILSGGNGILPAANTAGTEGVFKMGTASATSMNMYERGDKNLFITNSAIDTTVTGSSNITLTTGTTGTLTSANNSIMIGTATLSRNSDNITLGSPRNTDVRTIAIGSPNGSGVGPVADIHSIALGSGNGAISGCLAFRDSAVVIGGSNAISRTSAGNGVNSLGTKSIAIGSGAAAFANTAICLGAASGIAGGTGPNVTGGAGAGVSGVSSIAIGSANNNLQGPSTSLTVGTINIGSSDGFYAGASALSSRSIAVGSGSTVNAAGDASLVLGSASGIASGIGPRSTQRNGIAIGSAQSALPAATTGNTSSIAIGGSDGISAGPISQGLRSICIGVNANTNGVGALGAIVIGSSSTNAAGLAPIGSGANSIAIGSAQGAIRGANTTGASALSIGASDGITIGAAASNTRSIALGNGASSTTADHIILGDATANNSQVGIGITPPTAKLHVVGVNGTPIITLNQVTNAAGNAPRWLNPSVSASAGTPIHYNNGTNQLFGFTSSKRYKTNIREIKDESEIIYKLTPVLYDSKEEYGEGYNIAGFIAEDVYNVEPSLAILNSDHHPENVAYNSLHAFVIKEIQKHSDLIKKNRTRIREHEEMLTHIALDIEEMETKIRRSDIYTL